MDRHEAYRLVQRHAHEALGGGLTLREALEEDAVVAAYLTREELDRAFEPERHLEQVGAVFRRLGLAE
jgi:adenylosuccinate lyase